MLVSLLYIVSPLGFESYSINHDYATPFGCISITYVDTFVIGRGTGGIVSARSDSSVTLHPKGTTRLRVVPFIWGYMPSRKGATHSSAAPTGAAAFL